MDIIIQAVVVGSLDLSYFTITDIKQTFRVPYVAIKSYSKAFKLAFML